MLPPFQLASLATEDVLQHLIDGQLDGALRQRTGSTYGVDVSLERLRGGTVMLEVRTSVANEHLDASLAELHRWFVGSGVSLTDKDVELAKFGALVSHSLAVETTHDLAELLFDYARWGFSPKDLSAHARRITSVETARVNALLAACRGSALVLGMGDERRIRGAWAALR